MKKILSLLLTGLISINLVACQNNEQNNTQKPVINSTNISALVAKEFPMIPKNGIVVEMNKDLNLWQVYAAGQVMYITLNGEYFIGGHYFKFGDNKNDLTQNYIDEKNIINVSSLPMNLALKTVKGNGNNIFYVFSDPECPYCHMLQSEVINKLSNTTVYTFLYPLQQLHPQALSDSIKILCDKNPSQVFESWMTISPELQKSKHDEFFSKMSECNDGKQKMDKLLLLGQTLNIMGTPTIITNKGKKMNPQDLANLSKNDSSNVESH